MSSPKSTKQLITNSLSVAYSNSQPDRLKSVEKNQKAPEDIPPGLTLLDKGIYEADINEIRNLRTRKTEIRT